VLSQDFPAQLVGLRAGSLVAGYRLEAQVGAGGMAVVFRARDERLGRLVALKVLVPALAADPGFRRRFIAESRAAAAVDDPHIIPIYEAGEADGALFIAMRFVRGGDLRQVLHREGALPPDRATGFISPVASALDAAHGAGLVHRDVKPANILVDARQNRPDHLYLSDFGVSKGAISSVSLTGAGHFLGTPDYSAPEQIQGLAVDGRIDQYALACVAYQLLTGVVPFERDQGMAVLFAHLSEPPPSLAARRPGLPEAADAVLARALAKVPEKRYGSCVDFADALREALGLAPHTFRSSASGFSGPAVTGRGSADRAAAATLDPVSVSGPVNESTPAIAAGAVSQPTGKPRAVGESGRLTGGLGKPTADGPASAANIVSADHLARSDPGYGNDRVYPGRRPKRGVAHRRSAMTVSIRRHRLLAIALAATVLAVAGVVPFVLPGSPAPRSPGASSSAPSSHASSAPAASSRTSSSRAPSARGPSYSRVASLIDLPTLGNTDPSLAFSPSGATLAATGGDSIDLWNVATQKLTAILRSNSGSVAFSPGGTTLATAFGTGDIYLWNAATRSQIATLNDPSGGGGLSLAFSPDGTTLATAGQNGRTYLWNVATKKVIATLTDPNLHSAESVAFSPDGATVAIGSSNGRIYLWNIAAKTLTATLTDLAGASIYSVAFSPNGMTLAVGDTATGSYLWNVATRTMTAALTDPNGSGVNAVAFSPDGTTLAVGDNDGRTYLWNVATIQLTATLADPDNENVTAVAFSPDGTTLAIGQLNGRVYLWHMG
jgi:hypothetical protein